MKTETTIRQGLAYIASQQLPSGGFLSYSSSNPVDFKKSAMYQTTFITSLVLNALSDGNDDNVTEVNKRAVTFLLTQKSSTWSFNYWDRTSEFYTKMPYPDDLDDTFCALLAIWRCNPALLDGEALAAVAHLLIACETEPGGPYRTWLVSEKSASHWLDVDVAVNANIGSFLAAQGVAVPGLTAFIERSIARGQLSSPYYLSHFPIIYFLSHLPLAEKYKQALQKLLFDDQIGGHWHSPLNTALALTALLRFGVETDVLRPATTYLLRAQAADGSWPAEAFCIDPVRGGKTHYAGSAVLTTALSIEALQMYNSLSLLPATANPTVPRSTVSPAVGQQIATTIKNIQYRELRDQTTVIFQRLSRQDKDGQITGLAELTAQATGIALDKKLAVKLGTINLWGWMAYTVYDDFLDSEGDVRQLPSANFCLRQLDNGLRDVLPENKEFQAEIRQIMDRLDAANSWELAHCRGTVDKNRLQIKKLPDYRDHDQLAARSIGHTIAGLAVLYTAGFGKRSTEVTSLESFFFHYLIARQLNDEAHDWEEDLRAGHINAVAVKILQRWQAGKATSDLFSVDLDGDQAGLRLILWEKVIVDVCALVRKHVAAARSALKSSQLFVRPEILERLLMPVEAAAGRALERRETSLAFIKQF